MLKPGMCDVPEVRGSCQIDPSLLSLFFFLCLFKLFFCAFFFNLFSTLDLFPPLLFFLSFFWLNVLSDLTCWTEPVCSFSTSILVHWLPQPMRESSISISCHVIVWQVQQDFWVRWRKHLYTFCFRHTGCLFKFLIKLLLVSQVQSVSPLQTFTTRVTHVKFTI